MSLKVFPKFNIPGITPNLECFYLVIQVRSIDMNDIFGLTGTFVTWVSKLTSPQKPFWLQGGAETFKIMTLIQDLPRLC